MGLQLFGTEQNIPKTGPEIKQIDGWIKSLEKNGSGRLIDPDAIDAYFEQLFINEASHDPDKRETR